MRPVALLTDFGLADHYVGVLHAVLEREAPGVGRIDLGHQVPPGNVWTACFLLRCAWSSLPDDAVVLAVVDPGVGGDRRPLAARIGGRWLVAPDNGLAAAIGVAAEVVTLDWQRMGLATPSATFHGRDLFAPAAARLARGDDPATLGDCVQPDGLEPCPIPEPDGNGGTWHAVVIHVDRFGNLITNLQAAAVPPDAVAWYGAPRPARRVARYGEAAPGEVVLLEGSSGLLELAVNRGSAAALTGLGRGDTVDVTADG
jgi:S-adenosyl-L-methionine hydrolase (adenosine-forming)